MTSLQGELVERRLKRASRLRLGGYGWTISGMGTHKLWGKDEGVDILAASYPE